MFAISTILNLLFIMRVKRRLASRTPTSMFILVGRCWTQTDDSGRKLFGSMIRRTKNAGVLDIRKLQKGVLNF